MIASWVTQRRYLRYRPRGAAGALGPDQPEPGRTWGRRQAPDRRSRAASTTRASRSVTVGCSRSGPLRTPAPSGSRTATTTAVTGRRRTIAQTTSTPFGTGEGLRGPARHRRERRQRRARLDRDRQRRPAGGHVEHRWRRLRRRDPGRADGTEPERPAALPRGRRRGRPRRIRGSRSPTPPAPRWSSAPSTGHARRAVRRLHVENDRSRAFGSTTGTGRRCCRWTRRGSRWRWRAAAGTSSPHTRATRSPKAPGSTCCTSRHRRRRDVGDAGAA